MTIAEWTRFARKRKTGAEGFNRQWSLALSDSLETVPKFAEAAGRVDSQLPTLNAAKSMGMTAIDVISNQNLMVDIRNDFTIRKWIIFCFYNQERRGILKSE